MVLVMILMDVLLGIIYFRLFILILMNLIFLVILINICLIWGFFLSCMYLFFVVEFKFDER